MVPHAIWPEIVSYSGPIWAAIGPLVGVLIGSWLTARWQRRRWILDNKTAEYRGVLDALNTYRWRLINYQALYGAVLVAQDAKTKYEDDIALAQAQDALNNAFADRLFTRSAISASKVREDYSDFARRLLSEGPVAISHASQMLNSMHAKLVRTAETDLNLSKPKWRRFLRWEKEKLG